MIVRVLAVMLVLSIAAACGVKTDLEPPPGAIPQKGERDASKPPDPLGQ
jgi:hypothetical protein